MSKIIEEEEEIDIVGDYEREISNISSGQILSCEYTVHPRWLTDSADLWAESGKESQEIELSEISELEWPNQQVSDNFIILDKDLPVTIEEEVVASSSKAEKTKKSLPHPRSLLKRSLHSDASPEPSSPQSPDGHSRLPLLSEVSDCDNEKTSQRICAATSLQTGRETTKRKRMKKKHTSRPPRHKKSHRVEIGENITIIHDHGNVCNGQEECIRKEFQTKVSRNDETDEEVDIETDDQPVGLKYPVSEVVQQLPVKEENHLSDDKDTILQKSEVPQEIRNILDSEDIPQEELRLNPNEITAIEKFIFAEFFDGRATKTPDRFLKIRTHILNSWANAKPSYVGKTAVRSGLKNCGDVNCISRIHTYLEQIGVINFGHAGEYFHYIRPLWRLLETFTTIPRKNSVLADGKVIPGKRNRIRHSEGMNFTIQHTEDTLLRIPIVRERSEKWKRSRDMELVKCRKFSPTEIPPFSVTITLGTLLGLQLHSLTSHHEVMGFLGGHRRSGGSISLERYKPCRTSKQSGTMCEMCPVSQVEQGDSLLMEGFQLLGWFHSHPLFPPNPSRMDIETQREMQRHFSAEDTPFVGFILGCVEMNFKCIYIIDGTHNPEHSVHEIDVHITNGYNDLQRDLQDVLPFCRKLSKENIRKFKSSSRILLQQQGLSCDIENLINFDEI